MARMRSSSIAVDDLVALHALGLSTVYDFAPSTPTFVSAPTPRHCAISASFTAVVPLVFAVTVTIIPRSFQWCGAPSRHLAMLHRRHKLRLRCNIAIQWCSREYYDHCRSYFHALWRDFVLVTRAEAMDFYRAYSRGIHQV